MGNPTAIASLARADTDAAVSGVLKVPSAKFEIRFLDYKGSPLAGKKCVLDWGSQKLPGTTDGSGVVKFSVPSYGSTHRLSGIIHVEVFAGQPPLDMEVVMMLQLPPGDQAQGVKLRLNNLGYLSGTGVAAPAFSDQDVRALDRFRFANKIFDPKTMVPQGPDAPPFDAPTKDRIEDAHDKGGPLMKP